MMPSVPKSATPRFELAALDPVDEARRGRRADGGRDDRQAVILSLRACIGVLPTTTVLPTAVLPRR